MLKFLLGFLLGGIVAAVATYLVVLPGVKNSYLAVGFNDGSIQTRDEIARNVAASLGSDFVPGEHYVPFYDVKATSVVVVERSGVKTLRVQN